MGHHYRYQFTFAPLNNIAVDLALWALTQTAPATSLPLFIWEIELCLAVGTGATGNLAVRLQREATAVHSGGSAGVIARVTANAPASGASVILGAPTLTAGTVTTAGRLASWARSTATAGSDYFHYFNGSRFTGDVWAPIAVVSGTEQLALVTDLAIPNTTASLISGSIHWSEGP